MKLNVDLSFREIFLIKVIAGVWSAGNLNAGQIEKFASSIIGDWRTLQLVNVMDVLAQLGNSFV